MACETRLFLTYKYPSTFVLFLFYNSKIHTRVYTCIYSYYLASISALENGKKRFLTNRMKRFLTHRMKRKEASVHVIYMSRILTYIITYHKYNNHVAPH